ncbi:MAG: MFS transporter [Chloroflexi bacterium]|nr:MFS transporter [Chloroflexota bacterium]
MHPHAAHFQRDRYSWLSYGMLAYFAYLQAILGPLMPFLRAELDLSYTLSGLHFSAFALGMVLAGLFTDAFAARFGRSITFWGGGLGMALGALLFIRGERIEITLPAIAGMATFGTMLVIMIQSTLSDRHGLQRGRALTEANLAAGIAAGLAPLMIGLGERSAWGWRSAIVLAVCCWLCFILFARWFQILVPRAAAQQSETRDPVALSSRLPQRFWLIWSGLVCCVALEWCVIYWASTFLEDSVGLSQNRAAVALSAYFVGGIIARFAGSQLTRKYRIEHLLQVALWISALAFPLFWLAGNVWLVLLGLFILGLGVANLFPFALVAASAAGHQAADQASARISLGNGCAILVTPQLLGIAADSIGIDRAYGIVLVLLVLAFLLFRKAERLPPSQL